MPRIYDLAAVVRSKNAGPFTLTIDLVFADDASFRQVLRAPAFSREHIAQLYGTAADVVQIHRFDRVLAIKVSLPRTYSSGSAPDTDVYGCQQHFPLAAIEV